MKKVFDQTVRDIKREVNKKVLKVPGIEQKILDATSNEPWGPHGSLLADIAQATQNHYEYQMIMNIVWKRINDTGKNWRHVYKGLIILDYLVAHGTERVIDDIREHAYQISALADFQYIDSAGRDQGSNVRRKSQSLVSLVNDKERIQEVRQKALATRDKYRSAFATSGTHRSPGGYGGGYDNDRYEGSRYDNRNGYGREREYGYRDDDRYGGPGDTPNREGDRYSRDSNERYGRDYREDEFKGSHSNHEYAEGSGRRSYGRERDSYGDDEAYSSRGRGSNADGPTQDERPIERKLSNQQIASPPPNYEDVTRDGQDNLHDDRNGATVPAAIPKVSSPSVPRTTVPAGQVNGVPDNAVEDVPEPPAAHVEPNGFDEFDPRGSIPDSSPPVNPSPVVNSLEMDLFGSDPMSSLALVSVPQPTTTANVEQPVNSGFETNSFMGMPPTSIGFGEIDASNPFGDPTPFKAAHEESPAICQPNAAPAGSFQATGPGADANPFQPASAASFGFGDTLGDLTFASNAASEQQDIFANTASLPSEVSANPSAVPHQSVQSYVPSQAQPAVAGPSPVTHAAPTTFAPQAPQAMAPNRHAIPQAAPALAYSQTPHPAATNPFPIPQAVASSYAPSQVPQPAASSLSSGQSNFFMQPASGAGVDSLSGVPTQNGAPSYIPPQTSQFTAPANQLSQPSFLPQTGTSAPQLASISRGTSLPLGVPNSVPSGANFPLQSSSSAPPEAIISALQVSQTEPLKKFEPKSTVWSDTLSRGLVNLDISGSKANPHADIGVDFDSINRKEKRQEKKTNQPPVVSTVTMGKAMGSGSGIGRVGAGAMAPPSNPMGAGRGMGMGAGYGGGMGMNRPMGMGIGMGMNQQHMGMGMGMNQQQMGMGMNQQPMGMNMGMGMNQGMPMRPPMGMGPGGMPGAGYNPMGTAYGGQQPYGGYR
ncbi:clathrin interactor EPSIN 2-like [Phragmites australis]|uniref:clathrin interactor EPSIN 2-like n=1 Tax=Phragmites australis TaxID=29695 RepID=UPI002D79CFE0|nr:clathrin interactor EPSIN 2-like [Phragmites australis]